MLEFSVQSDWHAGCLGVCKREHHQAVWPKRWLEDRSKRISTYCRFFRGDEKYPKGLFLMAHVDGMVKVFLSVKRVTKPSCIGSVFRWNEVKDAS